MSITYLGNRFDPLQTSKEQKLRLGSIARDELGRQWSYVRFYGSVDAGTIVRDAITDDLTGGTVTAPTKVDATTGAATIALGSTAVSLTAAVATDRWIGAIGFLREANSEDDLYGPQFYVRSINSSTSLEVEWITGPTTPLTGERGLATATPIAASSLIQLWAPGQVYAGPTNVDIDAFAGDSLPDLKMGNRTVLRGIAQAAVTVVSGSEPYGWVLQKGYGHVLYQTADDTFLSSPLTAIGVKAFLGNAGTASGIIYDDSPPKPIMDDGAANRAALKYAASTPSIGTTVMGGVDENGSASGLIPLLVSIDNEATSFAPVRPTHPLNSVTIE